MGNPKVGGRVRGRPGFSKGHYDESRFLGLYIREIYGDKYFQGVRDRLRAYTSCLATADPIPPRPIAVLIADASIRRPTGTGPEVSEARDYLCWLRKLALRYLPSRNIDRPPYFALMHLDLMISYAYEDFFFEDGEQKELSVMPALPVKRSSLKSISADDYSTLSGWGEHRVRAISDHDWRHVARWLLRYMTDPNRPTLDGLAATIAVEESGVSQPYVVGRVRTAGKMLGIDPKRRPKKE